MKTRRLSKGISESAKGFIYEGKSRVDARKVGIPQLWLSGEEPPVGQEEPQQRYSRNRDELQRLGDVTSEDSTE